MTDSRSTLDDEVDDEPQADARETCWFWESPKSRCHFEPLILGSEPCADCPYEAWRGNYPGGAPGEDEHCNWCGCAGEMQSFEGRLFCGEDCASSWWYEWGHDD